MKRFIKNNWFKIVLSLVVIMVGASASYYLFSTSSDVRRNEATSEGLEKYTGSIEESIKMALPDNAILREYKMIPETKQESYLGIYILNSEIAAQQLNSDNLYYGTCPDETMGQSIKGEYHLFLYQDDKIINDVFIPPYNTYYGNEMSLSFNNTRENNATFFEGEKPNENDKYKLERTNLINFHDYNGDNLEHEFILVGESISCGHVERLVAGYDEESNRALAYSIKTGNKTVFWFGNFKPDSFGSVSIITLCGDHGSDTEYSEYFKFDKISNSYISDGRIENKCENL